MPRVQRPSRSQGTALSSSPLTSNWSRHQPVFILPWYYLLLFLFPGELNVPTSTIYQTTIRYHRPQRLRSRLEISSKPVKIPNNTIHFLLVRYHLCYLKSIDNGLSTTHYLRCQVLTSARDWSVRHLPRYRHLAVEQSPISKLSFQLPVSTFRTYLHIYI